MEDWDFMRSCKRKPSDRGEQFQQMKDALRHKKSAKKHHSVSDSEVQHKKELADVRATASAAAVAFATAIAATHAISNANSIAADHERKMFHDKIATADKIASANSDDLDALKRDTTSLTKKLATACADARDFNALNTKFNVVTKNLSDAVNLLQLHQDTSKAYIVNCQSEYTKLQGEYTTRDDEYKKLEDVVESHKATIAQHEATSSNYQAAISMNHLLRASIDTAKENIEQLHERLRVVAAIESDRQVEINLLNTTVAAAEESIAKQTQEILALKSQSSDMVTPNPTHRTYPCTHNPKHTLTIKNIHTGRATCIRCR
jgi:predicted HicB family RNase H-like nuclease